LNPTRGNVICKVASTSVIVIIGITIACIADSYHKINEGYVGIYFKHGALQDRVTDPGVHFMMPFIEDYKEVKIRPETFAIDSVLAITKDGIENTFREINTITTVKKDKLVMMA
jgi:regulator of protease activity HflC (stomatin/prohibitin superfamily)